MHSEQLGEGNSAAAVLRALHRHTQLAGTAPPAAITGSWFGSRAIIAPTVTIAPTDQPFGSSTPVRTDSEFVGGGWFGYLSYPDPTADGRYGPLPAAVSGYSPSVLRLDTDNCWWFESLDGSTCPSWVRDAVTADFPSRRWTCSWTRPDQFQHHKGVESCLAAIRDGEVYQACVCGFFTGSFSGNPLDFYADAITQTSPGRAAFLSGDWGSVASLSPELFLARHGNTVTSSPIKGTLPIAEDPLKLRQSIKDVAENVMIVDLVRNDLGRLARPGSVNVTDLLGVYPAPGVWHLVSTVQAEIDSHIPVSELLDAMFPPASVTGTPKQRARTYLQEWEPEPRGIYCGTIGFHSPATGLELNVAIRTVEFSPPDAGEHQCRLGVGGGITIDSQPETEWRECLAKASSIVGLRSATR
ncbi:aminodeoxychorismate synthase component I [Hoyosella rhizosphaerae]|uniref:Aminodeoxychorismate synthase component I n=1 Tax=Hoyosella rhizosphaerae TaxID=1755582 RepID=A0A916UC80_9ACTN|nr:aminodeoxychorismate synthase component I [Hoyosella rhizosphaerae]MBN4925743.1 aminodeoxychorismate synthase component I [Hoyosella rhizosphaerae]GGC68304.1 aminodeoxychorismate synthase component I [Hoyosella rhizosphaerae]